MNHIPEGGLFEMISKVSPRADRTALEVSTPNLRISDRHDLTGLVSLSRKGFYSVIFLIFKS